MITRIAQVIFILILLSCNDKTISDDNTCVKGKYIGGYCSGFVIEILDNSGIGKDLNLSMIGKQVKNGVIAHIDTSLAKPYHKIEALFPEDSIFYFTYKYGKYPPKAFILCPQEASIIITSVSPSPCNIED